MRDRCREVIPDELESGGSAYLCGKPATHHGYCEVHYRAHTRQKALLATARARRRQNAVEDQRKTARAFVIWVGHQHGWTPEAVTDVCDDVDQWPGVTP